MQQPYALAARAAHGTRLALVGGLLALLLPWAARAQGPTVSAFTPASGPAGTPVTITGTNLNAVTGVRFGTGTLTTNFVSQSATSLTVRVPVVTGTGLLTLTNTAGASAGSATAFTYAPRPGGLVAALSPTGPLDGCQPRTLTASAASPAFATGTGFNSNVWNVTVQADGKVLVGGSFASYNGTTQNNLVRLNPDGSRDASLVTGAGFNSGVYSVAVQADGKVLVGGGFTSYQGTAANFLVRLNADGSRDASFATGAGFNNSVLSVAVQADGKVLVGGSFTAYNGTTQNNLVRLNADGSRDASFAAGAGFNNGAANSVAVQADGKVLVGGAFSRYNGSAVPQGLVRLNADGSRDAGFAPGAGFDDFVEGVAVQADGKVLVGGSFTSYNGTTFLNRLVRLNADGTVDAGFATGAGFNRTVTRVTVQADGKVLVVGSFTSYQGSAVPQGLVRLNADGSRDASFATGAGFDNRVLSVAVQADGKVLVGGGFTAYNGTTQNNLVRLNADGSPNTAPTAVSGASFTFSPGTTANPLVTSTAGSYTATASLNGETSAPSNAVVLTACGLATRGAAGQAVAAQLYPNPARGGAATLAGALPGTVVTVLDALGRAVATATADVAGRAALALPAGLPAGVYVVRAGNKALRMVLE